MDIILTPQIRRLPVITYFTGIPLSNPTIDAYVAHLESSFPYKDIVAPLDKIKESFIPKILTLPPISYIRLHHISKARHFEQAIASLKKIVVQEDASVADADSILTRLKNLCTFILEHIAFENKYTHDFMRKFEADEAALESNKEDHAYDLTEYAELKSQVEGMLADINAEADAAVVALMIKEKLEPLLSKVEFMVRDLGWG